MALVLENGVLNLRIEEPGRIYNHSRFDWTGNISQILFEDNYSFCSSETIGTFDCKQHGRGLHNEFGISAPVGYDDCEPGEKFPKIGAGLLTRKSAGAYQFFQKYEIDPFDFQIERGEAWVKFTVFPRDCRGYSSKLVKKIVLSGSSFSIDYELENTGTRRIQTDEYCHNFIAINGSAIDEHYTLRVPCEIVDPSAMRESVNPENAVILNKNSLNFRFAPEKDFFYSPLADFHSTRGEWELLHDLMGIGMKETVDFVPEMMNVWGLKHVISPELFIKIDLEPGHVLKWKRKYTFYHL
jgi:hypothetical protein